MRKYAFLLMQVIICVGVLLLTVSPVSAGSLTSVSDTVTTSRPSASAPLAADQAASATSVAIYDNKSFYLASDSAILQVDTGQTQDTVIVASMSGANTPTSGQRTVYFVGSASNTHHSGTPLYVPVTALHTVQFTTANAIPASGKVVITFPGSANNSASPSASTFAFNNLNASGGLPSQIVTNNITCNSNSSVTAPTITCETTGSVSAGTTITFLIGCTAQSSGACTTQSPRLINPTKSATGGQGASATTADIWKVIIQTTDNSNVQIDNATAAIGTIEPIIVTGNVDPTLTFTITGINDATAINTGNTVGCTNTEITNTGVSSLATNINLGNLGSSGINIAAQRVNITTNAAGGYSLTATSSGHFINQSNGFWINDSTTPGFITAGFPWFGIHPCGQDVNTGTWGSGTTGGGANAKYGWPTQTSAVTLASDNSGPIDNSINSDGDGITSVEYAATVNAAVPQGTYSTYVTYVATPTF